MNLDVSLIFSLISCIGVIFTIIHTSRKDKNSSDDKTLEEKLNIEKNFVKINLKLDTFCDDVKEILKNQEKSNDELKRLSDQLIKDNERITTLYRFHEDHEQRLKRLEEK